MAKSRFGKRRIVQVIAPAPYGGAESVVRRLVEALAVEDVLCTIVALGVADPQNHAWVRALRDDGYDVRCPKPSRLNEHLALSNVLRDVDAIAVHSHGYRADIAVWRAERSRTKWVSTVHGYTGGGARVRLYEALDRWALRRADRVIAVSSRLREELERRSGLAGRVVLARNVPKLAGQPRRDEARRALNLPLDSTIVGWVGRMSYEKGVDRLPAIFGDLTVPCSLVLVGDGPLRPNVVDDLNAIPHLDSRWLGVRSDASEWLAAFDLLILPSRTEGMPMVVLEAMSACVPVVAFDVGDVRVAVTKETGWCVTAGNLQAFTDSLFVALRDPAERVSRGTLGPDHLQRHFSAAAWITLHCEAYGVVEAR